jgi:cytochrome c
MMGRCLLLALALVSTLAHAQPALDARAHQGRLIFESRCVACHSLDANRVGPALGTVVGRVAGKAPDFAYSKALGSASHRWSVDKLDAWLAKPEAVVPGQAMGYSVPDPQDRRAVVAYLASLPR